MTNLEKVIKGLECHAEVNCVECPYREGWRTCSFGETLLADALTLLKEQNNWLGIHQTVDGIKFISSGTAKQGEERGFSLGKELMFERLEKELLYRGLLTDDIRSAFAAVKSCPELSSCGKRWRNNNAQED